VLDTQTGRVSYNPPFYYFGHFSRFIKPGAKRIACTSSSDDFLATAFVNVDGRVAVVILNQSDADRFFQLWVDGRVVRYPAPSQAIFTIVF
jgi:glucosylceramidase